MSSVYLMSIRPPASPRLVESSLVNTPSVKQIKLSETVVLIDAAFLNFVITDMKGYFEKTLQRSLQEIDLSMLTTPPSCTTNVRNRCDCVANHSSRGSTKVAIPLSFVCMIAVGKVKLSFSKTL